MRADSQKSVLDLIIINKDSDHLDLVTPVRVQAILINLITIETGQLEKINQTLQRNGIVIIIITILIKTEIVLINLWEKINVLSVVNQATRRKTAE
jgi:hypothetical protein